VNNSIPLLFLMGSLIMLLPFANTNLFLNTAMALGDDADYYSDNSYSKYPTNDNKYECQTGPLEGFFVSSVEFCKFNKFDKDDRKDSSRDNRTGTQGPPAHKEFKVLQVLQVLLVQPELLVQQEQQAHQA
jgi:hypothetical protein